MTPGPFLVSAAVHGRGVGLVLRGLSVVEQRYQAVLAVVEGGLSVSEAAAGSGLLKALAGS